MKTSPVWWFVVVMLGVVLATIFSREAHAQRTGGSFGGSAWGSGGRVSSPSFSRPSYTAPRPPPVYRAPVYVSPRPGAVSRPIYPSRPAVVVRRRVPVVLPIVVGAHHDPVHYESSHDDPSQPLYHENCDCGCGPGMGLRFGGFVAVMLIIGLVLFFRHND